MSIKKKINSVINKLDKSEIRQVTIPYSKLSNSIKLLDDMKDVIDSIKLPEYKFGINNTIEQNEFNKYQKRMKKIMKMDLNKLDIIEKMNIYMELYGILDWITKYIQSQKMKVNYI